MIKIEGLTKIFNMPTGQITAVQENNLHVKKGEIAGIIGYSGAGKSTLVRCVNLLEQPTTGKVIVDGQEITGLKGAALRDARRKIGMIFQHFNLLYSKNVRENIAFPLKIAGLPKNEIGPRVDELLEMVGLSDRANSYPAQLSGGQKQRVGIARALANKPSVLLCDEATSALDPATTKSILELLKDINRKLNLTILIITHEMDVIKEICDTVYVMKEGFIIESGPVLNVFAHPQKDTTKDFINSIYNLTIPEEFYQRIKNHKGFHRVVKVVFAGDAAGEPVVASVAKNFNVQVNILAGNIDFIKEEPLGIITLDICGEESEVLSSVQYIKDKNLYLEVL